MVEPLFERDETLAKSHQDHPDNLPASKEVTQNASVHACFFDILVVVREVKAGRTPGQNYGDIRDTRDAKDSRVLDGGQNLTPIAEE